MLITHTGGHEKTHSINPGICRLKLWLLYYECAKLILEASNHASPDHRKRQCLYHRHPDICTRAMQETKEALTVIKYPWGLHTVHGQCFTCGMWCSIVKWLHCSMVLRKSITRIWINLAASLEYLSEIVCQTKECQQNYSSPSTSKTVRQWHSCKKVDCKHTMLKYNSKIILCKNAHYWQMPADILEWQQLWLLYGSKKWGIPRGS